MLLLWTIALSTIFVVYVIQYIWTYWQRLGVKTAKFSIPWGHAKDMLKRKKNLTFILQDLYKEMKAKGEKYTGMYMLTRPMFIPIDLEVIKNILQNDFESFMDRGLYVNEKTDPLSAHLVSLSGQTWKNLRAKLTPTFTSGKLKLMYETMHACSKEMLYVVEEHAVSNKILDVKDLLQRFTIDIIGSTAFGVECNCIKNPNAEFAKMGRHVFKTNGLKRLITVLYPQFAEFLNVKKHSDEQQDFFVNLVKETCEYRKKNNVQRNDFLQLLMNLQDQDDSFTMLKMTAQIWVFFIGGFDTSSTTMSFCLHELAKHQNVQDKVRKDINTVLSKYNGQITYDSLMEMNYLDMVISETLRKHPVVGLLNRIATKDYDVPKSNLTLKKGTGVLVPTYALHHDPEIYRNPELFDPERFSEENKKEIPQFAYLPFGAGPRNCIGARFGQTQTRLGLAQFLRNHKVSICKETIEPLDISPINPVLNTTHGIYLKIERVD